MSTGPKTKAGRARIAEAQRRRWRAFRAAILSIKKPDRTNAEISSQAMSGKSRNWNRMKRVKMRHETSSV
jgi:hypothetical protein